MLALAYQVMLPDHGFADRPGEVTCLQIVARIWAEPDLLLWVVLLAPGVDPGDDERRIVHEAHLRVRQNLTVTYRGDECL
jgi:hypothetical protein